MRAIVSKQIGLRRVCQRALFCTVMLILTASGAYAEDHYWSSLYGGSFNYWLNWVPQFVPGEDDTAIFELGMDSAYEVTFYESVTNERCIFRNDKVNLDLGGFSYALTYPGWGLTVGEDLGQVAEVLFGNGTFDTDSARIGTWPGSTGSLELVAPLTMNVALYLFVGNEGDGLLNVHDGVSLTADYVSIGAFGMSNTGMMTLDGSNAQFTINYLMTVGDNAFGFLNLYNGASVNAPGVYVGGESTGYGEIVISDESEFVADWLSLGRDGDGLLAISQAGRLNVRDLHLGAESGAGWVELMDADSSIDAARDVSVGSWGHGAMFVYQQAALTAESLLVGAHETAEGTLDVSGSGTAVTVLNSIQAGQYGVGSIGITDGADVRTTEPGGWIKIGDQTGSNGYIGVNNGSALTAEQARIFVGNGGHGAMDINAGSEVHSAGELFMGWEADGFGSLTIWGAGSKYVSYTGYPAIIGHAGEGEMFVENGGRFEKPGACFLGVQSTGVGTITLYDDESVFKCEQLSVGEYGVGTFTINDGRVALGYINPGDVPPGEMHMAGYYSQLTGTGTLSGNVVSFDNAKVMPGGDEAASLTGILTIDGDYTQQDARLTIKIKGPTAGDEYGVLNVTDAASLGGELRITPIAGFEPIPGDEFVVLTAASVLGTFDATTGLDALIVTYNPDSVVVTIPHPGDLNCDAEVNLSDVEPFIQALIDPAAYQTAYPDCSAMLADLDGNGTVDGLDIQPFVGVLLP